MPEGKKGHIVVHCMYAVIYMLIVLEKFLGYLLMMWRCLRFGAYWYLFASVFTVMPSIFLLIASHLYHSGVDFKVKYVNLGGKKLKLAIWDTGNSIMCLSWVNSNKCAYMLISSYL